MRFFLEHLTQKLFNYVTLRLMMSYIGIVVAALNTLKIQQGITFNLLTLLTAIVQILNGLKLIEWCILLSTQSD